MARVALVVADPGLSLVGSRGRMSQPSPGLALIDGDTLLVGEDARRTSRLKPRRVHSRFWELLDTQPLERPFPRHLRSADLVHAHLSDFWSNAGGDAEEAILVVPGVYSNEQLALLLGIANAADVPVCGLVDLGVAAAADRDIRDRCFHLDLHLHRAILTEIENGKEVARGRVWEFEGAGLVRFYDLWARAVARLFVRQTRFDPLHLAVTEQLLYLELPRHLERLTERETTRVSIASGGKNHSIDLSRDDLMTAGRNATDLIAGWVGEKADPDNATILVSDFMASVPGLVDRLLETTDSEVEVLHPAAAGSAALGHAAHIVTRAESLPLITRLPAYDARPPGPVTVPVTPPAGSVSAIDLPTHFVVDGVAQPITETPTVIPSHGDPRLRQTDADLQRPVTIRRVGAAVIVDAPPEITVAINGDSVEGSAALVAGDRLHLGEPPREILLVTMVP